MSALTQADLDDVAQSFVTNLMGFASFTILIWDHILTFGDEVEYIWNGKKGPIVWLFFLNRYLTPLGFIVNLFAYLWPSWTPERCQHFIRYEGSMTVIGIEVVGLMMLLRVYAMYYDRQIIPRLLACILVIETAINAWLLTHGEAVPHSRASGVHACTMIFDPTLSKIASSSAWIPLLYDTIVVALTLYRTVPSIRHKDAGDIIIVLLEDGLMYYSVIFSVTFVLTLMIIFAPPGTKNITAQLELLLTVAMMSRITLNLRKIAASDVLLEVASQSVGPPNGSIPLLSRKQTLYLDPTSPFSPIDNHNSAKHQSLSGSPSSVGWKRQRMLSNVSSVESMVFRVPTPEPPVGTAAWKQKFAADVEAGGSHEVATRLASEDKDLSKGRASRRDGSRGHPSDVHAESQ